MPLARKSGYGLCRESTSKSLIRLSPGWFSLNILGGAYCPKSGFGYASNTQSYLDGMQTYTWNLLWGAGSGTWVSTGTSPSMPLYLYGRNTAINRAYPWKEECTQGHTVNQFQFPSFLTGYNITGARLWLESAGETYRNVLVNASGQILSDTWYAQEVADITGGLNVRFSTAMELPRFAWDGYDLTIPIDTLVENSWNTGASVEPWTDFPYRDVSRITAGAWAYYDLSSSMVTWLNNNRIFYMHTNWTTGYVPFYFVNYSYYMYIRTIRGMRLQVYCEL